MIDGMFISYRLLDRSGRGDQQEVRPNEVLWENFREHRPRWLGPTAIIPR
jgi:hypothetical protein